MLFLLVSGPAELKAPTVGSLMVCQTICPASFGLARWTFLVVALVDRAWPRRSMDIDIDGGAKCISTVVVKVPRIVLGSSNLPQTT